eukprot:1810426-Amphidinium_carterae.1
MCSAPRKPHTPLWPVLGWIRGCCLNISKLRYVSDHCECKCYFCMRGSRSISHSIISRSKRVHHLASFHECLLFNELSCHETTPLRRMRMTKSVKKMHSRSPPVHE